MREMVGIMATTHVWKGRWMMTNRQNGMVGIGLSFVTGCVVGGIAGLLGAPQSGVKTRRRLSNYAADVREKVGEVKEEAAASIHNVIEQGRTLVGT